MEKYTEKINKIRFNNLRNRFEVKPYSQEWSAMQSLVIVLSFILQIGTGLMAGYFAYYGAFKLFGQMVASIVAAVVAVGVFETAKRIWFNKAAKFYFQERLTAKHKAIIGVFITGSILMSFFGTPLAVQDFAPRPSAPVRSEVVAELDSLEVDAMSPWVEMSATALAKADQIHAQNNWKGVTTRAARDEQLTFEAMAAKAQDSVAQVRSIFAAKKAALWESSQRSHKEELQASEQELAVIGWVFAGVCLLFEGLFLLCIWWLTDYSFHQYTEYLKDGLSMQEPVKAPKHGTKQPTKRPKPLTKQVPKQAPIGFTHEGAIKNDGRKYVILCKGKDGELREYSKSELSRNIANCKGEAKEYWKTMKTKLDEH
jgi:hypothetical protein